MKLEELRSVMIAGEFHHATYRNHGTLWEGLWIYRQDTNGFQGYSVVGNFPKDSPEIDSAFELVRGTGVSVGAYERG